MPSAPLKRDSGPRYDRNRSARVAVSILVCTWALFGCLYLARTGLEFVMLMTCFALD